MNEKIGFLSREIEIIKKNQMENLELKYLTTKLKSSLIVSIVNGDDRENNQQTWWKTSREKEKIKFQ